MSCSRSFSSSHCVGVRALRRRARLRSRAQRITILGSSGRGKSPRPYGTDSLHASRALHNQPASRPPCPQPFPASGRLPYHYAYQAKVRNVGARKIRGVDRTSLLDGKAVRSWAGTSSQYQAVGAERVRPCGRVFSAPSKVVTAEDGDGPSSPYRRREFRCVWYADGTLWASLTTEARRVQPRAARADVKMRRIRPAAHSDARV